MFTKFVRSFSSRGCKSLVRTGVEPGHNYVCPKGLDCSKYEFQYIGKVKDKECCEQYIENLVHFYVHEEPINTSVQRQELESSSRSDSPSGC